MLSMSGERGGLNIFQKLLDAMVQSLLSSRRRLTGTIPQDVQTRHDRGRTDALAYLSLVGSECRFAQCAIPSAFQDVLAVSD